MVLATRCAKSCWISFCLTEGSRKNRHFLYNSADEQPVAGQLMGAEPEQFALGAKRLVEAGFAVIDINFGCQSRRCLGVVAADTI